MGDTDHTIGIDEVDDLFSDLAIGRAIARAGLSIDAAAKRGLFAAIRSSVCQYAIATRQPTMNTRHREIDVVAHALDVRGPKDRDYYRLARTWAALSDAAREILERRLAVFRQLQERRLDAWDGFAAIRGGRLLRPRPTLVFADVQLPTTADLQDPNRRAGACKLLFHLMVIGRGRDWEWPNKLEQDADGHNLRDTNGMHSVPSAPMCVRQTVPTTIDLEHPGGQAGIRDLLFRLVVNGHGPDPEWCEETDTVNSKRLHNPSRLRVHAPTRSRAEPRREAVRELVARLELDWLHATGSKPSLTARKGALGPFARLIAEILCLAQVPINNDDDHDRRDLAAETLNYLATIRRRRRTERSFRRILNPLCQRHGLVDEVRRLVELGEADVLSIGSGADCQPDPAKPALIEFQETGTICFYRPPFGWKTIAIRPFPLRRIMNLAGCIAQTGAGERLARAAAKRRRAARSATQVSCAP